VFGWLKTQAGLAKVKLRGCAKVEAVFTFTVAAYNLIRIPKLLTARA
jgi:Transposase DDE domain